MAFAIGERPVSTIDDVDEEFGALPTDGGEAFETNGDSDADDTVGYTEHVEPLAQIGARHVRCKGCCREVLTLIGREKLIHSDRCPNGREGQDPFT